ncbi:hypothetical protein [Flavobacterium geliluteum]|uniref:Lipocalin-like domain-containing protein n=1 Tax=Flavobacterium geliluteum TaxID=2816120 RepID=A0A941B3M0_9FLAO|nr:hypothetical protein [Flavobacterium geliluteum]MBP4138628.1 hypothetical protein [Flavobacterium geliluteum]
MKNSIFKSALLLFAIATITSCSNNDDNNGTDAPNPGTNLGTFAGNIQVANDPFTSLGYIYNAKVTVSRSGTNATIKVTGNEGFDREYKGEVTSSSGTMTFIQIQKQIKPVEKIAGTDMLINGNDLTIDISLASDNITVKPSPTSSSTINIIGKIRMIGTGMIKQ